MPQQKQAQKVSHVRLEDVLSVFASKKQETLFEPDVIYQRMIEKMGYCTEPSHEHYHITEFHKEVRDETVDVLLQLTIEGKLETRPLEKHGGTIVVYGLKS